MSDKRPHIKPEELAGLIRQYLAGELDDKAMHDLEHQALDDPFLAAALEGYAGRLPEQQVHQADLASRLAARVAPQQNKVRTLYYRWAAAAAILLVLFSGGWFLWNQQQSAPPIAAIPAPAPSPALVTVPDTATPAAKETKPAPANSGHLTKKSKPPVAALAKRSAEKDHKAAEKAEPAPAPVEPAPAPVNNAVPVIEAEHRERPLAAMKTAPVISPEKAKGFVSASNNDSQRNALNEVVVMGYSAQKKQNMTGSTATVRIRGRSTIPADSSGVEDALAGRMAGVSAVDNNGNVLEEAYRAPSPLTGETAFENYLRTKTVNPDNKYNGIVRVSFTVMPDGTLQHFKVIRHLNDACDAEAIRVIKEGPAWIPASDRKPAKVKVKVRFTVKKD